MGRTLLEYCSAVAWGYVSYKEDRNEHNISVYMESVITYLVFAESTALIGSVGIDGACNGVISVKVKYSSSEDISQGSI